MKILFINRAKSKGRFSFEELFSNIKKSLTSCTYEDFYDKSYPSFIANIKAVRKIQKSADILHLTGGLGYYSVFLPKKKTILTIHDTNHYEHDLTGLKKWIFSYLFYKLPYKNTIYLTTVSEHTKSRLIELFGFKPSKIKVVPNCYPSDFSPSSKEELNPIPKILQIGTKRNKNIIRLVEAIKNIPIELTIIGKLNTDQETALKDSGVNFINKTNLTHSEIYNEYVNCDIVSFVSLHEGFGLPIVEANIIGRAIITSSISSMPEVANNAAHMVNPNNVDDIKGGILKLIENNTYRNTLISNGFENVKQFSPQKIASLYEELYTNIKTPSHGN